MLTKMPFELNINISTCFYQNFVLSIQLLKIIQCITKNKLVHFKKFQLWI